MPRAILHPRQPFTTSRKSEAPDALPGNPATLQAAHGCRRIRGAAHDFRSALMTGSLSFHAVPTLVAATTSRQLVAARIRVRTRASAREQGDKRGDNRQNLSCPPSTWPDRAAIADANAADARTRHRQPILHRAHACARSPKRRRRFVPPQLPRGRSTSVRGVSDPPLEAES